MTTIQINLVQSTWEIAAVHAETIGPLFYNRLFEIAPELKPMFSRTTVPEQSRKLLTMLSYVISKLDALDEIIDEVGKLAQRHVRYGVEEKHFTYVGAALIWTLEKGLGEAYNQEVKEAWMTCYDILSNAMITAMGYATQDAA